jgi:hypothetical protein
VGRLCPERQHGVLQHGRQVASYLERMGVGWQDRQLLLLRCPLLFSWPPAERARPLFQELTGLGIGAHTVAACLASQPSVANCASFAPGIACAWLADLLAEGLPPSVWQSDQAYEVVAKLLRDEPSAAVLLKYSWAALSAQLARLEERGFTRQEVAADFPSHWQLLRLPPRHLDRLEAAFQRELQLPRVIARAVLLNAIQISPSTIPRRLSPEHVSLAWLAKVRGSMLRLGWHNFLPLQSHRLHLQIVKLVAL